MGNLFKVCAVVPVLGGLCGGALADECAAKAELRSYFKPATLPDGDTRCDLDNGRCVKPGHAPRLRSAAGKQPRRRARRASTDVLEVRAG